MGHRRGYIEVNPIKAVREKYEDHVDFITD